jgi:hypothetical protein
MRRLFSWQRLSMLFVAMAAAALYYYWLFALGQIRRIRNKVMRTSSRRQGAHGMLIRSRAADGAL